MKTTSKHRTEGLGERFNCLVDKKMRRICALLLRIVERKYRNNILIQNTYNGCRTCEP